MPPKGCPWNGAATKAVPKTPQKAAWGHLLILPTSLAGRIPDLRLPLKMRESKTIQRTSSQMSREDLNVLLIQTAQQAAKTLCLRIHYDSNRTIQKILSHSLMLSWRIYLIRRPLWKLLQALSVSWNKPDWLSILARFKRVVPELRIPVLLVWLVNFVIIFRILT